MIQSPNETLRDYLARFNKEALQIKEIQVDIIMEAMKRGTWHKEFFDSLETSLLKTIRELMRRMEKYIKLDDALRLKRKHDPVS